jgi:hypothetical protein
MPQANVDFWRRAREAQEKLAEAFLDHPDVTLIDIGYAYEGGQRTNQVVLRVHVKERWVNAKTDERIAFPDQVNDIPVRIMVGDYQLETGTDTPEEACDPAP